MLIEVEVCDVCRRLGVPVTSYTITETESGRSVVTVRCGEHAAPFEEVLGQPVEAVAAAETPKPRQAKKAATGRQPRGQRAERQVMTREQIDAAKAAGKA
ncbi:hypothetical protein ACIA8F_23575 [Streptomyces sp. NPDC051563]|uniref:hypothetical protein n=1 Tax=Streptomyces sp. NPDC051563 TaxID=3365659 RepID=UPI0037872FE3